MPPDPKDYGSGHRHTRAQVEAFTITDKPLLLDYLDAVCAQTKSYLATVSNADLNRVLNEPQYQPLPTLSIRLASVVNCNTRHAGQIEYLRGLVKHRGWFPAPEKVAGQRAVVFSGATSQKNFSRSPVQVKAVQLGRIPA